MQRHDTRGTAARRKVAQAAGHKMAADIKVGEIIAVQDRTDQGHSSPYLLAQALDAGDGTCIIKRVTQRESIGGTSFTRDDFDSRAPDAALL